MLKLKNGKHISIRIDNDTHYKFHYISKYYGRSGNGQILWLIRKCINEFENENEKITMEHDLKKIMKSEIEE